MQDDRTMNIGLRFCDVDVTVNTQIPFLLCAGSGRRAQPNEGTHRFGRMLR